MNLVTEKYIYNLATGCLMEEKWKFPVIGLNLCNKDFAKSDSTEGWQGNLLDCKFELTLDFVQIMQLYICMLYCTIFCLTLNACADLHSYDSVSRFGQFLWF